MMAFGYLAGSALGFTEMDSLVLGGMLAMSSTMVIIKVFDELGVKGKHVDCVMGTLVVEDIVGIFFMVVLSTISVSRNVSGLQVTMQLLTMLIYLVIWLVLGIFFLPTFLDRTIKYMNDEMLIVTSLGICFGMVMLAQRLGFSTALGAFVSGSLLAGTVHVERIESLTRGIKDMFGAVFFVSVGMMVDPEMIVKYWLPIVVLILVTIIGQPIFGTIGMLISGQNLRNAILGGMSFAQIGEFSFIIASLGSKLGILDDFMYPIAVAVSVATILTTPIYIRNAQRAADYVEKKIPSSLKNKLRRMTSEKQGEEEKDTEWNEFLKGYFLRFVVFGGIMMVTVLAGLNYIYPGLSGIISDTWAKVITCIVIYIVIAVFLKPLLDPHNIHYTALWLKSLTFRLPLIALAGIKIAVAAVLAVVPLRVLFGLHPLVFLVVLSAIPALMKTHFISTWYLNLQTAFLQNFNERLIKNEEAQGRTTEEWIDKKLYIMSFYVEQEEYAGKTLRNLDWGRKYNIYAAKIRRPSTEKQILLPDPDTKILMGDKVFIIGEKQALLNFITVSGLEKPEKIRTLKEFMDTGYSDTNNALAICPVKLRGDEDYCNKSIRQGGIRNRYKVAILGLQTGGLPIIMPDPNMLLRKDDILWIIGSNKNVGSLISEYIDEAEEQNQEQNQE